MLFLYYLPWKKMLFCHRLIDWFVAFQCIFTIIPFFVCFRQINYRFISQTIFALIKYGWCVCVSVLLVPFFKEKIEMENIQILLNDRFKSSKIHFGSGFGWWLKIVDIKCCVDALPIFAQNKWNWMVVIHFYCHQLG